MKSLKLPSVDQTRNFKAIDPLDSRYYDSEISQYLSEQSRITYQAYVEAALAHTLAEFGICSKRVAGQIENASLKITATQVYKEEQLTRHDIKAVVNSIKKHLPDSAKPYVHFGATSYDIVATAQSLQMREVTNKVVVPRLRQLLKTLIKLADKHAETVQVGRTHGQHALPITFGFALSEYISRLGTSLQAIEDLTSMLQGKFSGAVGSYNALDTFVSDPLKFEKSLLHKVGLTPAPYSTQIIPPEGIIRLIDEMTIAAGIMANLSNDMRHLQRTEIDEVREAFAKGQTGSSTMAHKRNPINFENVVSLSKEVISQSVNANLNLSSEHQRDLTDSASSRFYNIVPASVATMAKKLDQIMNDVEIDDQNMYRNLRMTIGVIAAEPLYLLLAKYGHTQAHEKSKELSHKALQDGISLVEEVEQDAEAHKYWLKFTREEQKIILEPETYYTGLSAKKTKLITSYWSKQLGS